MFSAYVAGFSQPSSNVAREIRISQVPQRYYVLFRYSWRTWRGPPTSGAEPCPTIRNKVKVAFLSAFLSRVFQLADEVSYLRLKQ